jgi:VWFA-related protein
MGVLMDKYRQASMSLSENVMAELADGTGGTFYHNHNDLEAGLSQLFSGPEYMYLLALSANKVKPNGVYHELKVKMNQNGLTLQARRGYVLGTPGKTKK